MGSPYSIVHAYIGVCTSFIYITLYTIWVYHIFFIYSPIDGHWGCSHSLAIVNNAVVNMGYLFELMFLFSSDKYWEVGLLDCIVVLFFLWGTSLMAAPFYIPINNAWRFHLFCILANTCSFCSSTSSHPNGCGMTSHCSFDVHFSYD